MLLDSPPSVTVCHTFSDPLRYVLYARPLGHIPRHDPVSAYVRDVWHGVLPRSASVILGLQIFSGRPSLVVHSLTCAISVDRYLI